MAPLRRRTVPVAVLTVMALVGVACTTEGGIVERPRGTIGFIFVGARDDLGYNQAAWEASITVARRFPDQRVLRVENVPESPAAVEAMESLIADGATLLFATSFGHLPYAVEVARANPEVVVVHQGGVEPSPGLDNLGTFFGAHAEALYAAGIAAGAATTTGRLGFVAAFPIPATFNNVNAFTLGARAVRPDAVTEVVFTGDWCDPAAQAAAAGRLLGSGADVLAQHQDCTRTILEAAEAAGAGAVGYHSDGSEVAPRSWLVGAVWTWDDLFVDIVETVLEGRFTGSPYEGDFRGTLRRGDNPFTLTEPGPRVAPETTALMDATIARFEAGATPFDGPITDRDGTLRVVAGATLTEADVDAMDWFVAGVEGEIPAG